MEYVCVLLTEKPTLYLGEIQMDLWDTRGVSRVLIATLVCYILSLSAA